MTSSLSLSTELCNTFPIQVIQKETMHDKMWAALKNKAIKIYSLLFRLSAVLTFLACLLVSSSFVQSFTVLVSQYDSFL